MKNQYELDCIHQALIRDRNSRFLAGLVALGLGIWALQKGFNASSWFMILLGIVGIGIGLKLSYDTLKYWKPSSMRLIRLLFDKPKSIVWVYSIVTVRLPFGIQLARKGTMYFKLDDTDEITIRLYENDIPKVAKYLNQLLPHATFGHTQEREQWYMANPLLLVRDDYEE